MAALTILFFILFTAFFPKTVSPAKYDIRIIGGVPTTISAVPYQVSLENGEGHICGGSIIHKSYILTAAHCLEGERLRALSVRAGTHFLHEGGLSRRVCSSIVHSSYRGEQEGFDYDIAILRLCQELPFGPTVLPVVLPEFNETIKENTPALVSGWGFTSSNGILLSNELQQVWVVIKSQKFCRNSYRRLATITNRMLCAGCKKSGCDSCDGDSGGPLVANGKLVGIVSWGYGCAHNDYPGVYSRVSKFRKWIRTKIKV